MSSDTQKIVRARDVMHSAVTYIDGMETAKDAVEKMRHANITALVVRKRNSDDAWGIVTVRDLISGAMLTGRSSENVNIYEIMTKPIVTVPADMDIRYVARLMHRASLGTAPVEENGELVGIVTLSTMILENDLFW